MNAALRFPTLFSCGLLAFWLGLPITPAQAQTTRYVTRTGNSDPVTAFSWAASTNNIQWAIDVSSAGDVIWVAAGTYKPTTSTNRTISFQMKNGVAIYGGFVGNETALDQRPRIDPAGGLPSSTTLSGDIGTPGDPSDNSYHVISNSGNTRTGLTATAVLDGFVVTGGNAVATNTNDPNANTNNSGGGVYNAAYGGTCSPTFRYCLFQDNFALFGAGMANDGYGQGTTLPQLTNCAFQNNTAFSFGGAMFNNGNFGTSSPSLTNCLFRTNEAFTSGGAIYNLGASGSSSPGLTNCVFQTNTADYGGAIYNDGRGGQNVPQLVNCTFRGNTATQQGRAIYNLGGLLGTSRPGLTNSVFWDNGGANTFFNDQASITTAYCLFEPTVTNYNAGTGNLTNVTTSPFVNTTSLLLRTGSPAINAGSNAAYTAVGGPAADLAGNIRNVGTAIDMGAYEFGSSRLPVTLRYFSGRMTDAGALLGWQTAREDNNAYFNVERSRDALSFESIATIPSQTADGNSVTSLTYSYLDTQPLPGTNYYRLMQTDRDGTRAQAGNVIALSRDGVAPVLFPNPVSASGEANIEPAVAYTGYQIIDLLGRVVQQTDAPGVLSRVNLAGLPAGAYVLMVQTDGGPKTWRLLR